MGQAAGTADGGFVHNMASEAWDRLAPSRSERRCPPLLLAAPQYIGDNTYQFVYGNDREVMTFDCAGASIGGQAAAKIACLPTFPRP